MINVKDKKIKILNLILPLITIVVLVAILSLRFSAVLKALGETLSDGQFYIFYLATLTRSIIAFLVSFILALLCAIASKKWRYFESVISPIIKITRALPTIAVVLLLVITTSSSVAPIIVTMLVVFPTMYTSVKESLSIIDEKQLQMCKIFGVDSKKVLFKVQLPQILPSMLETIGAGLSLNLKLMVAAEVLASTYKSLGNLLNSAKYNSETAMMVGIVLICVLTGLILETAFHLISKKVGKWQ